VGDKLYFANCDLNGLYKVDLETKECKFVSFFPDEPIIQDRLYLYACCNNEQIVFSPFFASHIAIFNVRTEEFKTYNVPKKYWWSDEQCRFLAVEIYGQYAYFYGLRTTILRLNLINGEMKFWDAVRLGIDTISDGSFGLQIRRKGNYIYNVVYQDNKLFRFSILTEKMNCFSIELPDEQLICVETCGNKLCIITDKNIWNWSDGKLEMNISFEDKTDRAVASFYGNEHFFISKANNYEIEIISTQEKCMKRVAFRDGMKTKMVYDLDNRAICIGEYKGNIICYSTYNNALYILDENYKVSKKICMIDADCGKFINVKKKGSILTEGIPSIITLESMINEVCFEEKDVCYEGDGIHNEEQYCNVGEKILHTLIERKGGT